MPSKYIPKKKRYHKILCKHRWVVAEAVFDNVSQFQDFLDFANVRSKGTFVTMFSRNEKLVLYLKYALHWGRRRVRQRTGLSERYYNSVVSKLKNFQENPICEKRSLPHTCCSAKNETKL